MDARWFEVRVAAARDSWCTLGECGISMVCLDSTGFDWCFEEHGFMRVPIAFGTFLS